MKNGIKWNRLFLCFAAVWGVYIAGVCLSGNVGAKYDMLLKPPFSPPGRLFTAIWPILYVLLGITVYIILENHGKQKQTAIFLFCLQLTLNFLWSIVFFRFGLYWTAAAVIILHSIVASALCYSLAKLNLKALLLNTAYLVWILFTAYLNLGFAIMNS